MIFYELQFHTLPKIMFACTVETKRYRNRMFGRKDMFEFSILLEGDITLVRPNGDISYFPSPCIIPITPDNIGATSTPVGITNKHVTVGVSSDYSFTKHDSEKLSSEEWIKLSERCASGEAYLTPDQGTPFEKYSSTLPVVKSIGEKYSYMTPGNRGDAISDFIHLMALSTRITHSAVNAYMGGGLAPSVIQMAERAEKYIAKNYREALSVEAISSALGISVSYLHRIFKQVKGIGVTEYITYCRMEMAKTMLSSGNTRAYEIAAAVGYSDPLYFSRVFKKYFGVSFSEYAANAR